MPGIVPVGAGLSTQVVVKDEGTFGVAPSLASGINSYEIKSETLELKKTTVDGDGMAAGRVYRRTRRRVLTNYDLNGDIVMELPTRNLGWWLRYMIGDFTETPVQLGTTGVYQTVFQPVSTLFGHSFALQKGVPAADNATVEPFTEVGCKLTGWEINIATGAIGALTLHVDGRNELAGPFPNGGASSSGDPLNAATPALATWNGPTNGLGMGVFHFRQGTLFSGGTPTLSGSPNISITPPSIPASGTPQVNTTGQNIWVTTTGGTVTAVTVTGPGAPAALTGNGSILLPPNCSITLTYSAAPTWTWKQAIVSLVGETALGNVKDATVTGGFTLDSGRVFVGTSGFKAQQIENGYRALGGSLTVEWLSSEALYNAYAGDTTTSLQLTFTGLVAGTSGTNTQLLDIIIPNIKLNGESPKVAGPQVVTQAVPFTGYDDETTVPIQITYQSEDVTF